MRKLILLLSCSIVCYYSVSQTTGAQKLGAFRQQQQLERVKKWLQLRNRDTDHRTQVEERRRKREDEAKVKVVSGSRSLHAYLFKVKVDEILRREKAREQRTTSQLIGNPR